MSEGAECPWESLRLALAQSSRDWSTAGVDAWIWGIVHGWGEALDDVAARHGWDAETVARLRRLHARALNAVPQHHTR